MARELGFYKELNRYDLLLDAGHITKAECLRSQYALFRGYSAQQLLRMLRKTPRLKWIRRAVERFKSHGLSVIILSDNPTFVSGFFKSFGFDETLGSMAIIRNGILTGKTVVEADKLPTLRRYCRSQRLSLSECIHVGDWENDIPVFRAVGLSVALNPRHSSVARTAKLVIGTKSLLEVYRRVHPFLREPHGPEH